jgi:hypothetical protein
VPAPARVHPPPRIQHEQNIKIPKCKKVLPPGFEPLTWAITETSGSCSACNSADLTTADPMSTDSK